MNHLKNDHRSPNRLRVTTVLNGEARRLRDAKRRAREQQARERERNSTVRTQWVYIWATPGDVERRTKWNNDTSRLEPLPLDYVEQLQVEVCINHLGEWRCKGTWEWNPPPLSERVVRESLGIPEATPEQIEKSKKLGARSWRP